MAFKHTQYVPFFYHSDWDPALVAVAYKLEWNAAAALAVIQRGQ